MGLMDVEKPIERHPAWLKQRLPVDRSNEAWLRRQLDGAGLHTVCQEARCPNIHDCFHRKTATFLLMGDTCTRACTFCAIGKGRPRPLDPDEPQNLAELVRRMGLRYVVLTSVDRDDLPDGGAAHFVATMRAVRHSSPGIGVEVLTPDFRGVLKDVATVADEHPSVFNHNVETVPRLYPTVRPGSHYDRSLSVLAFVAEHHPDIPVKSGLMLGHGETEEDVLAVLRDLRDAGVRYLSVGQYLSPGNRKLSVREYLPPDLFERLRTAALDLGFQQAHVHPFARSSYHADEMAGMPAV